MKSRVRVRSSNFLSIFFSILVPGISVRAPIFTTPWLLRSGTRARAFTVALPLVFSSLVEAQDIQWGRPHLIKGTGDISKHGYYVDAVQAYIDNDKDGAEIVDITIGDTVFHKAQISADGSGDGIINFYSSGGLKYFASGVNEDNGWNSFPTDSPSSTDYSKVVSSGVFIQKGDNDGIVTLSQLKIGHIYEVQVWLFVQDHEHSLTKLSGKNSITLDNAAGNVPSNGPLLSGAYGNHVLGTFKAPSPIEKFNWSFGRGKGRFAAISAIALRDITKAGDKH